MFGKNQKKSPDRYGYDILSLPNFNVSTFNDLVIEAYPAFLKLEAYRYPCAL